MASKFTKQMRNDCYLVFDPSMTVCPHCSENSICPANISMDEREAIAGLTGPQQMDRKISNKKVIELYFYTVGKW